MCSLGSNILEVWSLSKERREPGSLGTLLRFQPEVRYSEQVNISRGLDTVGNPLPKDLVSKLSQCNTYERTEAH